MKLTPHPEEYIAPDMPSIFRNFAAEAEKLGRLHPAQLAKIYEKNLFNLFVPKVYGGLELSLPEALRREEALAWADGSVGWTVTLCAGANWFIGFLRPDAAQQIFNDPKACLAGSGRPSGIAKLVGHNYEISGKWKYATGAPYATVFTANCLVEKDGKPLKNGSGVPVILSFWFKKKEVRIHEDWDTMGMRATASHSFEITELQVAENRTFHIDRNDLFLSHPVYKYPFLQFAEATLAINISGMSIHFLELCELLFKSKGDYKDNEPVRLARMVLRLAEQRFREVRDTFYTAVETSWQELIKYDQIDANLLATVSTTSMSLAIVAREITDHLFPHCGMAVADAGSEMNRIWRDIHTASQHILMRPQG